MIAAAWRGQGAVTFQQAYEAAAARYAPDDFASRSPLQIVQVIYEEMRRLDAQAVGLTVDAHLSEGGTLNGRSYRQVQR